MANYNGIKKEQTLKSLVYTVAAMPIYYSKGNN
jgi:hypothetical protein